MLCPQQSCDKEAHWSSDRCLIHQRIEKFNLVWSGNFQRDIYVVVTDLIEIPYFHDGVASTACLAPLDFTNPAEWEDTFPGWIVWNVYKERYEVLSQLHNYVKITRLLGSSIPFDQSTGRIRNILGLMGIKDRMEGKPIGTSFNELTAIDAEDKLWLL